MLQIIGNAKNRGECKTSKKMNPCVSYESLHTPKYPLGGSKPMAPPKATGLEPPRRPKPMAPPKAIGFGGLGGRSPPMKCDSDGNRN